MDCSHNEEIPNINCAGIPDNYKFGLFARTAIINISFDKFYHDQTKDRVNKSNYSYIFILAVTVWNFDKNVVEFSFEKKIADVITMWESICSIMGKCHVKAKKVGAHISLYGMATNTNEKYAFVSCMNL